MFAADILREILARQGGDPVARPCASHDCRFCGADLTGACRTLDEARFCSWYRDRITIDPWPAIGQPVGGVDVILGDGEAVITLSLPDERARVLLEHAHD